MFDLDIYDIMYTIAPFIVFGLFIYLFALMISPKLRAKFMGSEIKATKYMLDDNKENLTDIATTVGQINVDSTSNIIGNNKEKLTKVTTDMADMTKGGIETTVRAIRKGITEDEVYCKHCGQPIDSDSKFCKSCGKQQ